MCYLQLKYLDVMVTLLNNWVVFTYGNEITLFEIVLQVKLSIYLAMGRMGVCVRSPKMGPTTCVCSRGLGKGSPPFILGQNQAGIWLHGGKFHQLIADWFWDNFFIQYTHMSYTTLIGCWCLSTTYDKLDVWQFKLFPC